MTERESWEHYVGLNWTDRFNDPPEDEEEISLNLFADASELSDEDFNNLTNEVEELGNVSEAFGVNRQSDFDVEYFYKSEDEEIFTSFTIRGWANESVYEELLERLDYYGAKVSKIA